MIYKIGQISSTRAVPTNGTTVSTGSADPTSVGDYKYIKESSLYGRADRITTKNSVMNFQDECLKLAKDDQDNSQSFSTGTNYIFGGWIKSPHSSDEYEIYRADQVFNVKLKSSSNSNREQFIEKIKVESAVNLSTWQYFQFIFSPQDAGFDEIVFEMERESKYDCTSEGQRIAVIIYEELAEIQPIDAGGKIVKLGLSAENGFTICIDGEEIKVGTSGQYEIQDGLVKISKLGFSTRGLYAEYNTRTSKWEIGTSLIEYTQSNFLNNYTILGNIIDRKGGKDNTLSTSLLGKQKTKPADTSSTSYSKRVYYLSPFVLDYVYEEEEN